MCAAALLLVGTPGGCFAQSLRVEGVPEWLTLPARKSLEAVWREIPQDQPASARFRLLSVVASRLFQGYRLEREAGEGTEELRLRLVSLNAPRPWRVEVRPGIWEEPVARWVSEDLEGLGETLAAGLEGVPPEAFAWGDQAFDAWVADLLTPRLPGWRATREVRPSERGDSVGAAPSPRAPADAGPDPPGSVRPPCPPCSTRNCGRICSEATLPSWGFRCPTSGSTRRRRKPGEGISSRGATWCRRPWPPRR